VEDNAATPGNHTNAFQFGGDFDKNFIMDNHLNYSGVPAMTMVQLYATCYPLTDVALSLSGAYYMSNISDDKGFVAFSDYYGNSKGGVNQDTTAYEIDVVADYAFTPSTTFSLGLGYAQITDLATSATVASDPDAIIMGYWGVFTEF
jgi:predicted porin